VTTLPKETGAGRETWAYLRLPPFSQVALRVLELASKENVQLHELSQLISSDPALASEILTIVNSLAYAPRMPIASILQAIAVMGANHLQGLCLTVAIRGYIGKSLGHPLMQGLWRHNLACATIAEQLAGTSFMDHDVAFTCGVMHDVGRLALATVKQKEYLELLGNHTGDAHSMLEHERALLGRDHCEMGRQLVEEWKLPEDFEVIVAGHHEPFCAHHLMTMPWLVNMSCRMADAAGFPAFPGCHAEPYEVLFAQLPERERRLFFSDVGVLVFEINKKIHAIESI
jgi:putative nucleotidyltransferase with HDIG domain